jgi:NAD(P)-dependent dehydrogenase (short-subunit alcohol dehydrogenase family)
MNRLDMFRGAFSLEGKVALVPGGAGEIGRAVGEALCAYGAKVILTGRTQDKAETAAEAIRAAGGQAEGRSFTAAGASEVESLVDSVYKDYKKVDILVNCVGKHIEVPAEEYKEEDWDHILNVNLKTAFFFSKEVGRRQIASGDGGKHVHVTSVRGLLGIGRGFISYCSSKGGMVMMVRQLASEWTKHKINVNGIAPTFIRTAQVAKYLDDPGFYKPLVARIPLGRVGETHEVAGLALYLAAPISDFVSGQIIYIDGGLTAIQ